MRIRTRVADTIVLKDKQTLARTEGSVVEGRFIFGFSLSLAADSGWGQVLLIGQSVPLAKAQI